MKLSAYDARGVTLKDVALFRGKAYRLKAVSTDRGGDGETCISAVYEASEVELEQYTGLPCVKSIDPITKRIRFNDSGSYHVLYEVTVQNTDEAIKIIAANEWAKITPSPYDYCITFSLDKEEDCMNAVIEFIDAGCPATYSTTVTGENGGRFFLEQDCIGIRDWETRT
jgi:hypothetical protein